MFSRDVKDFHYRTPRTLQSSKFGAYSKLDVPRRHARVTQWFWVLAYGGSIGFLWYVILLIRA